MLIKKRGTNCFQAEFYSSKVGLSAERSSLVLTAGWWLVAARRFRSLIMKARNG